MVACRDGIVSVDQDGSESLRLPVAVLDGGAFSRRPLGPVTVSGASLTLLAVSWLFDLSRFWSSEQVTMLKAASFRCVTDFPAIGDGSPHLPEQVLEPCLLSGVAAIP